MLTSAIRVLARTAAIQVEEVAATHAVTRSIKGKERETRSPESTPRHDLARPAAVDHADLEKSQEVKEVEEKIQRLLRRVKQPPQGSATASIGDERAGQAGPSSTVSRPGEIVEETRSLDQSRLPESSRAPKTATPHGPEVVQETHSKEASRLPLNARSPMTIQPSTPASSPSANDAARAPEVQNTPIVSTAPGSTVDPPLAAKVDSKSTLSSAVDPAETTPADASTHAPADASQTQDLADVEEDTPVMLRASKVPSSRIGRLFHYGSLAASLSFGAASESIRRSTGSAGQGSVFMSDANVRRLVSTLGRMRGAALKLGQFMSIQDNHMLPPEIEKVLQQVQAHANYMPDWQMERVMSDELGSDWQSHFATFDRVPVASASIGQVHKATLAGSDTPVAVKVQFPGIAGSINSDLANLSILIRSSALLPKGLYLQNTIAVMRRELEDECDYVREAASGKRFYDHLKDDDFFLVPKVIDEATTGKVLTTEWMSGKPLSRMKGMSQQTRDKIGTNILRLCLQELFHFRFMQTDPNWANFLYDGANDRLQLIDFGASREYTKEFMDGWYRLLKAALEGDREIMRVESLNLGYLTGEENEEMLKAHLDSMALIASPFSHKGEYAFAKQTITDSVRALIPVMLKHRLTPPPPETYSLNRKLSGAFLMCAKLGAHVDCQKLWEENVGGYREG